MYFPPIVLRENIKDQAVQDMGHLLNCQKDKDTKTVFLEVVTQPVLIIICLISRKKHFHFTKAYPLRCF